MIPHLRLDPNVIVFSLFPGIQDNIVRHVLESPDLRGIVMRTFGSGNALILHGSYDCWTKLPTEA